MPMPTRLRLLPVIAGLALVVGCNPAPAADSAKAREEVKTAMAGIVAAFVARDADKAVSWDGPDFVGMFHGTPNVIGQEADRALTKEQAADPGMKFSVGDETIEAAASGDLAVWRATYNYTFTDPKTKQPKTEVGNWVVMWKRGSDGAMKETWSVVSDTPAATPG